MEHAGDWAELVLALLVMAGSAAAAIRERRVTKRAVQGIEETQAATIAESVGEATRALRVTVEQAQSMAKEAIDRADRAERRAEAAEREAQAALRQLAALNDEFQRFRDEVSSGARSVRVLR